MGTRRRRGGDPMTPNLTASNVKKALAAKEAVEREKKEKEEQKKAKLAQLRGQRTEAPMRVESVAQAKAMGITREGENLNPSALYADGGRRKSRRRKSRRRR
jgi:hypothetical protein